MRRFLIYCAAYPWLVIALLLLVTLGAIQQIPQVKVQVSAEELLLLDDPERQYYEEIRDRFGDENMVLLILRDESLLETTRLTALRDAVNQLEQLPLVERVESLFSVPHVRSVEGYLDKAPYLEKLPADPEAAAQLLTKALKDPFLKHVLLSDDGRLMAVAVILKEGVKGIDDPEVTASIDRVTASLTHHYQQAFTIGYPYVRMAIAEQIQTEQGDLFPIAITVLLIALFLLLRQFIDILIPIITAGLSIVWTLGLMGLTGIPLNVVTSIVPILLIVIGSTEDIHLLAEFRRGQCTGLDCQGAIQHMARRMGRVVLLTFITTYAGFLSVGLSRIEVLWQFGILSSTGLAFNFLITVTLIPALLRLLGKWRLGKVQMGKKRCPMNYDESAEDYWNWLQRHKKVIYTLLGATAVIAALGVPSIQVNHNTIDSLAQDSEVRRQVDIVNHELAGLEEFSIIIDSGIQDTFLKVRYLEEANKIQAFIEEQGFSRSTTSFANYLSMLNGAFQELEGPRMPVSDDVVNELMIFLDYRHVKNYVSEDYSTIRILVRHNIAATHDLKHFVDRLQAHIQANLDPGLEARITGSSVLTLSATDAMIEGQLDSIMLLLLFFIVLMSLLFMDIRVGLLAALPNAFPVLVLFGVMGYAGIPLNIGTTMAAAIAIGIAVDDTMHFMLRYNHELKSSRSQSRAIQATIRGEALPIFATSIALISGFLVFTRSEFEPIALFGMLGALVIAAALIADFMITPLAVSMLRLVTLWDLLSSKVRQSIIPHSALFKGMRPWQIRRFILSSTVVAYAEGDTVFHRGDRSDAMYLIMNGVVEVRIPGGQGKEEIIVDQFGPGELFGDVALLAGDIRRANAVALTPCSILVLSRDAIRHAVTRHPILAGRLFLNLASNVSERWVHFIEQLHNKQAQPPSAPNKNSGNSPE